MAGVRVEAGDLKGPGGSILAADARLYRQHQFHLTKPTYRNDRFKPGWYPDALIPFDHPLTRKPLGAARLAAVREFADRYHINAVQVLHPDQAVKDPVAERGRLGAWLKSFDRAAAELDRPQVLFYTYLKDEPNTEAEYKYVQRWGRAVREVRSAVKVLVVEQPQTQDPAWGDLAYWSQVDDPWVDPQTYWTEDKSVLFNGEGSLLYPGRAAGYDGIAPSLRLKALRDSIDDYEYLAMLARLGRAPDAERIVLPLAPSWFQWEPDPTLFEPARAKLARLILAAKH